VDYYEPEPGTLLELERGDSDALRRPEPANLDPVQRFEFLTNTKAPSELVEAAVAAGNDGHEDDPIPAQEPIEKRSSRLADSKSSAPSIATAPITSSTGLPNKPISRGVTVLSI
jgi:hypothetical protein